MLSRIDRSKLSLRRFADQYELMDQIGEGSYGVVFKCCLRGDPARAPLAVKCVHPRTEAGTKGVVTSMASLREVKLLKELCHHPNIVKLRDVFLSWEEQSMHIVYEYAETDLNKLIKDKLTTFTDEQIRQWLFQLLDGTRYLHENWVLHRDLKPQNILVCLREKPCGEVLKIADFGLARIFQQPVKALSDIEKVVVTLWYRAPELLLGTKHYTKAVDMWAIGCIFGELLTRTQLFMGVEVKEGSAPFQESQCQVIFSVLGVPQPSDWDGLESLPEYDKIRGWRSGYPTKSVLRETVSKMMGASRKLSPEAFDLLEKLLALDPSKRITATEALKHPYFRGITGVPVASPTPTSPPRAAIAAPKTVTAEAGAFDLSAAVDSGDWPDDMPVAAKKPRV